MNNVQLGGALGRDPEIRQTQNGTTVVNFPLATSKKVKDQQGNWNEKTEWHRIVVFGKRAEAVGKYFKKGDGIIITDGELQTREWQDKDNQKRYTTEVVVNDFEFPPGRKGESGRYSGNDNSQQRSQPNNYGQQYVEDDDIPF